MASPSHSELPRQGSQTSPSQVRGVRRRSHRPSSLTNSRARSVLDSFFKIQDVPREAEAAGKRLPGWLPALRTWVLGGGAGSVPAGRDGVPGTVSARVVPQGDSHRRHRSFLSSPPRFSVVRLLSSSQASASLPKCQRSDQHKRQRFFTTVCLPKFRT